jgi:hypothetical protein
MSVPGHSPTLTRPLCLGSTGEPVRALQALLNGSQLSLGPKLTIDGKFGKMTHIAVIAFQRRKGLKPDGVVGSKTAKELGWGYRPDNEKPYTIRYDKPPLPAATPPLLVVAEAIRAGMDNFKEKLADDLWVAYSNPNNDPYYARLMGRVYKDDPSIDQKQFSQRILRMKDLAFNYKRFLDSMFGLVGPNGGDPGTVPSRLREVFREFVAQMIRVCDGMDFYYGITEHCRKRLKGLQYDSFVGKVEMVLRGERTAEFAAAEIQMVFQTMAYDDLFKGAKVVDRPSLEWLNNFQYHN